MTEHQGDPKGNRAGAAEQMQDPGNRELGSLQKESPLARD